MDFHIKKRNEKNEKTQNGGAAGAAGLSATTQLLTSKTCLKGKSPSVLKSRYFEQGLKKKPARSKVKCFCYPNRDAEFAQRGYKMENSLLTVENEIPGVKRDLSQVNFSQLQPIPGIYAIRCKTTKKCFVGETQNIKHRILTRLSDLDANRITNSKFFEEYREYGIQNFELILYKTGVSCIDFTYRKFIEYKLQTELSIKGLSYNTGISETMEEPAKGLYPSQAGVYCIRCKVNNACYFGETEQRRGIAGRLSRHKSNLRHYMSKNTVLQVDWFRYGEDSFVFIAIDYGPDWLDKQKRLDREAQLITLHQEEGGIVYNTFDSSSQRNNIPIRLDSFEEASEIERLRSEMRNIPPATNKWNKPIIAENNTYLSITEAARCLSIHRTAVVGKLQSGSYRLATTEEITSEKKRRQNNPSEKSGVVVELKKRSPGKATPVWIEDSFYESIAAAASDKKISPTAIRKSLNRGRSGYYRIDSEGYTVDNHNNRRNKELRFFFEKP